MGWMNDILKYIKAPFKDRSEEYRKLTFSQHYSFLENYILPFSHDEVIHGKLTMLGKMPGTYEEKFAGLRTLIGYMYAHPGLKLLFMGNEMAPFMEWRFYEELEWHLLKYPVHDSFRVFLSDINHFYRQTVPLWDEDHSWDGFKWIAADDQDNNIISFMRIDRTGNKILCIFNFLPLLHEEYKINITGPACVEEIFTSDLNKYSGSNTHNKAALMADEDGSLVLKIPSLSALFFKVTETGENISKDTTE
jgi:1,4-alpha-glucan branching enzyme